MVNLRGEQAMVVAVKRFGEVDGHVARRIRQRRREIRMSLEKLGEALGISFQQVQKYEAGTDRVSAGRLYVLAQALGVAIDYFFEGAGSSAENPPSPEPTGRSDKQRFEFANSFMQISSSGTRSAILRLVREAARGARAEARPPKE